MSYNLEIWVLLGVCIFTQAACWIYCTRAQVLYHGKTPHIYARIKPPNGCAHRQLRTPQTCSCSVNTTSCSPAWRCVPHVHNRSASTGSACMATSTSQQGHTKLEVHECLLRAYACTLLWWNLDTEMIVSVIIKTTALNCTSVLHLITLIKSELTYAKFQCPGFVQINCVNVINYGCAYSAMTCQNVCCDKIESSNKVHKSIFNKPLQHLERLSMTSLHIWTLQFFSMRLCLTVKFIVHCNLTKLKCCYEFWIVLSTQVLLATSRYWICCFKTFVLQAAATFLHLTLST